MGHFDFSEWANLYAQNPEEFEARREAALQAVLDKASPSSKKALEHAMFRIRMNAERSKSPLQRAMGAMGLMWESLDKLKTSSAELHTEVKAFEAAKLKAHLNAIQKPAAQAENNKIHAPDLQRASEPVYQHNGIEHKHQPKATVLQFVKKSN